MSNLIPSTNFSFNNVLLDNQELPNTVNLSFLQNENSTPSLSSTDKNHSAENLIDYKFNDILLKDLKEKVVDGIKVDKTQTSQILFTVMKMK